MKDAHVSLQIIPITVPGESYCLVDRVITMIRESGIRHIVGPMETTMEGPLDSLLAIVGEAHRLCLEAGAEGALSVVKIECRQGGVSFEQKMAAWRD